MPDRYENRPRRRFFSDIRYAALVCDTDILRARLEARSWESAQRNEMLDWNRKLLGSVTANVPIHLIDTTRAIDDTCAAVRAWITQHLPRS